MINLAIVSDIRLYREGLSKILNEMSSITVVGTAKNITHAVAEINSCQPEIVLLDMRMVDSFKLITVINGESCNMKLIVMFVPEDEANVLTCAKAGISGYISRESSLDELVDAVLKVHNGEFYCPSDITKYLLRSVKNNNERIVKHNDMLDSSTITNILTRRERQIINMMAEGLSNKQIAKNLTIEISTVKNHVHSVLVKLDAKSRSQAVSKILHSVTI